MRKSKLLALLACAWLAACWGGERTRPKSPTPAKAPFSPGLPIPKAERERPPPPPAPATLLGAGEEGPPEPEEETGPDRDPPAGQLGTSDEESGP